MKLTEEQMTNLPTRFFDGIKYYPREVFDDRRKAKNRAIGIRTLGWKSRVVSCKRTGKQKWLVYVRPKGKWTPYTPW